MGRTARIVLAYLCVVTLIALTFTVLPAEVGRVIVPGAIALVAAAAVLLGIRRYSPDRTTTESWAQIAFGLVLAAVADVVTGIGRLGLYPDDHPSVGDALTLIAYFMLDLGMEEEEAIEQAMRVGLRSPEMMQWGLGYVAGKK